MASILFFTQDTTHRTATYVKSTIESFGHTVTLIDDVTITSTTPLLGYDLIVGTRTDPANSTAISTHLRTVNTAGTPVLLGFLESGMASGNTYSTTLSNKFGLLDNIRGIGNVISTYALNTGHAIESGLSGLPATFNVYSSGALQACEYTGTHVGVAVASFNSANPTQASIIAVESGTNDLLSVPYGARVVGMSWLYSTGTITFSADGLLLIGNILSWLLSGGSTTVDVGIPISSASSYIQTLAQIDKVLIPISSASSYIQTLAQIDKVLIPISSTGSYTQTLKETNSIVIPISSTGSYTQTLAQIDKVLIPISSTGIYTQTLKETNSIVIPISSISNLSISLDIGGTTVTIEIPISSVSSYIENLREFNIVSVPISSASSYLEALKEINSVSMPINSSSSYIEILKEINSVVIPISSFSTLSISLDIGGSTIFLEIPINSSSSYTEALKEIDSVAIPISSFSTFSIAHSVKYSILVPINSTSSITIYLDTGAATPSPILFNNISIEPLIVLQYAQIYSNVQFVRTDLTPLITVSDVSIH